MAIAPFNFNNIPDNPGCYIYKDSKDVIIYVGKAKDLKKRVSSYFSRTHPDEKTNQLVQRIKDIQFIITKSEIEALILENNLIKKHYPKYNIHLKDSKRYAYIHIPDEPFPRLLYARDKTNKGKYFGPFTSADQRNRIIKLLRMLFKMRTCKKFPKRACLRYHINLCTAPCEKKISEEDYNDRIKAISHFLKGDNKSLVKSLNMKMAEYSERQNFEEAMQMRDTITALKNLSERQAAEKDIKHDQDVINYLISGNKIYLVLFNVTKGVLNNKEEYVFSYSPDILEEFITQYYNESPVPNEIIVPEPVDEIIPKYLTQKRKENNDKASMFAKVRITVPQQGNKKELLDIAKINLENTFKKAEISVTDLQKRLRLHTPPNVIECFDISNTQGTDSVGSMVQFRNGRPDKRNYRRYRIKTVDGPDDYSSINEVVRRRYSRLLKEEAEMPDLIVIDGGRGQLNAALQALRPLGLKIPIISLAKQYEEIIVPGMQKPIRLDKRSYALRLLQALRDEAHRFAIAYHKLLRKKRILEKK